MAWRIEFSGLAQKNLRDLDKPITERILRFLHDRITPLDDPRSLGGPLKGKQLGEFWRYRIGDYRIIADIQDSQLLILVVRISNRREVYR